MAPTVVLEYSKQKETKKLAQNGPIAMLGKTHKFSRGYFSSGLMPDYPLAFETTGESEGFGSSGRVDTEMTASEDSCAPKRKCISLNNDRCDNFGVPLQVLSLSKMSRTERKELELRLRSELEQVQALQKKIISRCTNGITLSSSSDIHSCSNARNGPGKKRAPVGKNGPSLKRGHAGRFESVNRTASSTSSNTMLMKQCETLLANMMKHQYGWVFNTPVDVVKLKIPDYFTVIKHPMDLGTIKGKLASGAYSSPLDFAADVRLTFSNAMTYNPPKNDVHVMADLLNKYFEVRWKPIEKKLPGADSQLLPKLTEDVTNQPLLPKKRKAIPVDKKVKIEALKRKITYEEKQNLSRELQSLLGTGEMPDSIIDFLRGISYNSNQADDEIEIDIDSLEDDTLFTLRKLLDDYLQKTQTEQAKAEPCEMELLNESGLSNSSMQPIKGNDPADEDIDIVGNDPPVSSYPPVEIEKDPAHKSSKCSSSSSSSSDSGSSSSDSDSTSSSGSESDGAKVPSPANAVKEAFGSRATLDHERSDLVDPQDGNRSVSGLDQVEQNSEAKLISVEANEHQEGENAPSERQVSPEKLYRAALLRSRFADTILKAREKTLDKGEKGDPEKLRREREELERQKREEKARLQAEAKAAEDARRQAEAEAAAEAKRKRELEREAARQALQKMEKTVEINENCQFLEDLEMLRSAPPEHIPSSVDETSPDHSQDGIGGFTLLGSSNPLEQLGLYMKVDDEEEEEAEPGTAPVNDVEEGEID